MYVVSPVAGSQLSTETAVHTSRYFFTALSGIRLLPYMAALARKRFLKSGTWGIIGSAVERDERRSAGDQFFSKVRRRSSPQGRFGKERYCCRSQP